MAETIDILIVEDDWVIAQDLRLSLEQIGYRVVAIAESGEEALARISATVPDMLILDIQLAGAMDGIALAACIRQQFKLPFIFLTSQTDRAILERAKLTEPQAFLVKPFNLKEVEAAVEIALYCFAHRQPAPEKPPLALPTDTYLVHKQLFVKVKNRLEKVNLSDILWIEAKDIYTLLKTNKAQFIISHSLKDFEQQLPHDMFMRIHRSFMVAIDKIEALEDNSVMIAGQFLPVGKTYKEGLLRRFKIF